jgi:hypothetical protein
MSRSCTLSPRKSKLDLRVEKVDLLKTSERTFLAEQDIDMLINTAAVSETGPIAEQPMELVREPQPLSGPKGARQGRGNFDPFRRSPERRYHYSVRPQRAQRNEAHGACPQGRRQWLNSLRLHGFPLWPA